MTSSLGRAEVPQAVRLTICSWSPVSRVISAHITKTLFMSHSKVHHIHSYLHVFLPSLSQLTVGSRTLFLLEFFFFLCILFSVTSYVCIFLLFPPAVFFFLNLTVSLKCLWFFTVTSLSYSHLALTALFFFLQHLHLSHLCLSPNLVPLRHSQRKPYTKTREFSSAPAFLLQSGCIMLFCDVWGQSSFEVP